MPDPAEQLQRLHLAGFEFQTFERFPKYVGVVRPSFRPSDDVIPSRQTRDLA